MGKLGYTWYPKDWGNSEKVFELNLEQRGLYRELIDMAMLNDNNVEINSKVWCRKFDIEHDNLWDILTKLKDLKLIEIPNDLSEEENVVYTVFIPSCEPRLNLVRGGKKGGKNKPTPKPTPKPFESLEENNNKPTPNQKKLKETKLKESESEKEILHPLEKLELKPITDKFITWFNEMRVYHSLTGNIKFLTNNEINNLIELRKHYETKDFERAFSSMMKDEYIKLNTKLVSPSHFLKVENFTKYVA